MSPRAFFAIGALTALVVSSFADSITIGEQSHTNVIVRESGSRYYVANPEDGKAFSVEKTSVESNTVVISSATERAVLQRKWEDKAGFSHKDATKQRAAIDQTVAGQDRLEPINIVAKGGDGQSAGRYMTDGVVDYAKLQNVPVSAALDATLGPLNLTYQVNDNYLFVTSPAYARTEANSALETRVYATNGMSDTLPKIVVANPGGATGGGASFGGTGFGGGAGGGIGQGGFGGGGIGGGGQAGLGGGGFAGGGQGGLGGGGFGGSPQISNISQLFFNIDDRLVGEPPAVIGMSVSGGATRTRQNMRNQQFNN
ncbi:MAG: hypothetical protein IT367_03840 [Candidatus Hydrogenedentes bacterium]|nr:hypothetical protein [Candidatus Hydrogenedentota bacterium]